MLQAQVKGQHLYLTHYCADFFFFLLNIFQKDAFSYQCYHLSSICRGSVYRYTSSSLCFRELCAQLPCHSAKVGNVCHTSTNPVICEDHKVGLVWLSEGWICLQERDHRCHKVFTGQIFWKMNTHVVGFESGISFQLLFCTFVSSVQSFICAFVDWIVTTKVKQLTTGRTGQFFII